MPTAPIVSFRVVTALASLALTRSPAPPQSPAQSPAAVAAELIAADSAFAAAAATTDAVTGISAMFAPDVTLPAPGGTFAQGAEAAINLLRTNPDNARGRASWTPVRVGISADGRHGFTWGYGILTRGDGTTVPWKYLGYWVKGSSGWRVVVYRRTPRAEGEVSLARVTPALPPRIVESTDTTALAKHRASLDRAERGFSAEAQRIGLGPAFAKWGRPDAVNMGGPAAPAFVVGAEAIGKVVGQGGPAKGSPVSWAPDRVIVASSGDLGVTIGMIRPNQPPAAGAPPGFSFFTVWYRESAKDPWRYIAE